MHRRIIKILYNANDFMARGYWYHLTMLLIISNIFSLKSNCIRRGNTQIANCSFVQDYGRRIGGVVFGKIPSCNKLKVEHRWKIKVGIELFHAKVRYTQL